MKKQKPFILNITLNPYSIMLPDNIIVKPIVSIVNKCSKITFSIKNLTIPKKYDRVQIVIDSVTKDFRFWCFTSDGKWLQTKKGVNVTLKLNNNLDYGLYIVYQLIFQDTSNPEDQIIIDEDNYLFYPFEIAKITDKKHSHYELMSKYNKITRDREEKFKSGLKYNSPTNEPINEYSVFIFVKDCLITMPMLFEFYGLMRYEDLKWTDEINLINKYLNRRGRQLDNVNKILDDAKKGQPTVVVRFPNIEAPSHIIAKNIAKYHTELTMNVLSVHRDSYGTIFASLVIDKLTSESFFEPNIPLYHGNHIGGFASGEALPELKAHIEKSRDNKLIQLYLTFYKEALTEKTYEFSCLRYWNLLEIIAKNTLKEDDYLLDYKGEYKRHHETNKPLKVKNGNTVQKVFELIRRVNMSIGYNIDENSIEKSIKVWNRRRNCMAHHGSCFADDPDICQINHPNDHIREMYAICKNVRDEMISVFDNLNIDIYLESLKDNTQNVIRSLLNDRI